MLKLSSETVGKFADRRQVLEDVLKSGFLPARRVFFEGEYVDVISKAQVLYNEGFITEKELRAIDVERDSRVMQLVITGIREALRKVCSGCSQCGAGGMYHGSGCGQVRRMAAKNRLKVNADRWYSFQQGVSLSTLQGQGFSDSQVEVPKICVSAMAKKLGISEKEFVNRLTD